MSKFKVCVQQILPVWFYSGGCFIPAAINCSLYSTFPSPAVVISSHMLLKYCRTRALLMLVSDNRRGGGACPLLQFLFLVVSDRRVIPPIRGVPAGSLTSLSIPPQLTARTAAHRSCQPASLCEHLGHWRCVFISLLFLWLCLSMWLWGSSVFIRRRRHERQSRRSHP